METVHSAHRSAEFRLPLASAAPLPQEQARPNRKRSPVTARPDIHLITPLIEDPAAFRPRLAEVLAELRPASLHLRFAVADAQTAKRQVQALAAVMQEAGVALLVDPPADLRDVARAGADGVHLSEPRAIEAALRDLKPERIVGVGGLRSRDAAMEAGEAGVDYVMFGEPRADGTVPPLEQVTDRCAWWAEVFNVPCIGYAADLPAVAPLARTGVEFVALGPWAFAADADWAAVRAALG
jgi:thiamine-phosphate pyrophosphorylase